MIQDNDVERKRSALDYEVSSQQDIKRRAISNSGSGNSLALDEITAVAASSTSDKDEQVEVKSRSEGSNPQCFLTGISSDGLLFISKTNKGGRTFIPSTKNFFGDIQVRKVLCDTGCSTTLLPIEVGRVRELFEKYRAESSIITIGGSNNAGGYSPVLIIEHNDGSKFVVKLCQNLVGSSEVLTLPRLRFSLCSDDVRTILEASDLSDRLNRPGREKLLEDSKSHPTRARRTHALLGQSIISNTSSVRYSDVEFFVISKQYHLTSWVTLHIETSKLLEQIKLPDLFDEWEDDDNIGQDDGEDFDPCYDD